MSDQNFVKPKYGVLCTDGVTLVPIAVDPDTGGIMIDTTSTISYSPEDFSPRDGNYTPAWLGESSVDGSVLPINVNAQGAILIDL